MAVRETVLRGTDLRYIMGREFVIFSNGATMTVDEFKAFHRAGTLREKARNFARVPARLSDYTKALEGDKVPFYPPVKQMEKKKRERKKKQQTSIQEIKLWKNKQFILLTVMLLIAIGSAMMSIYHATAFLLYGNKPLVISFITGVLLVSFAAIGFTAARFFFEKGILGKIFATVFICITFTLIGYIAFSTISVSYAQFRDEEQERNFAVHSEIGALELYKDLQNNIKESEKNIEKLNLRQPQEMSTNAWARHQRMLEGEQKRLGDLRQKAIEVKERAGAGSIEQKEQSVMSVYDFLQNLFGINSRMIRFIVYTIPAVFYDVVAPFGFTVVFFLLDRRENGKTV